MKIKVTILRPVAGAEPCECYHYIMEHDDDTERRHLGYLCRYLFECGWGIMTVPA